MYLPSRTLLEQKTIIRGRNLFHPRYSYEGRKFPLAVKSVFHGQALYETDEGKFAVCDEGYLILTLVEIAQVAAMSPHHFLRAFKQVFNVTPHVYLTQKRIERAQWLLMQTLQPITTVCFEVGFESLGSFSTLFKRHVGLSPKAFRQQFAQI